MLSTTLPSTIEAVQKFLGPDALCLALTSHVVTHIDGKASDDSCLQNQVSNMKWT